MGHRNSCGTLDRSRRARSRLACEMSSAGGCHTAGERRTWRRRSSVSTSRRRIMICAAAGRRAAARGGRRHQHLWWCRLVAWGPGGCRSWSTASSTSGCQALKLGTVPKSHSPRVHPLLLCMEGSSWAFDPSLRSQLNPSMHSLGSGRTRGLILGGSSGLSAACSSHSLSRAHCTSSGLGGLGGASLRPRRSGGAPAPPPLLLRRRARGPMAASNPGAGAGAGGGGGGPAAGGGPVSSAL
jgi:hypothetical protein